MDKISDAVGSFFEQYDKGFLDQLKNLTKANDLFKGLSTEGIKSNILDAITPKLDFGQSGRFAKLKTFMAGHRFLVWGTIIFLIGCIMVRRRYNKEKNKTYILAFPSNALDEYYISAKEAPLINEGTGIASTLNMWFKVDDWNYKFNEDKYILIRQGLYIFMAPQSPDLTILIETHDTVDPNQRLLVRNIPLQKWNNLALTFDGRTVDVWINSELRLSTVLKNLPKIRDEGQMVMCPYGGFMGQIGQLFVSKAPMRRREIVHLWRNGPRRTGRLKLHNPSLRVVAKTSQSK